MVFSSSCAVYGVPEKMPISEDTIPEPINPYGFSKLVCERMLDDFERAHGFRSARLRYFNAAGADPDGEIGEDHDPETHLIPAALDAVSGRGPPVQIFGGDYSTADGTAVRDYVHVSDLARAHGRALDKLLNGAASFSLNLGSGRGASVNEIIGVIGQVTGRKVPTEDAPRRAGDPAILVADARKARAALGWVAERSDPVTVITDAWRWYVKRFGSSGRRRAVE
jgi:UDP-arabinose 4-epimerase